MANTKEAQKRKFLQENGVVGMSDGKKTLFLKEGVSIRKKDTVKTEIRTVRCSGIQRGEVVSYPINCEMHIIHRNPNPHRQYITGR